MLSKSDFDREVKEGEVLGKISGVSLEVVEPERVFTEVDVVRNIYWLIYLREL